MRVFIFLALFLTSCGVAGSGEKRSVADQYSTNPFDDVQPIVVPEEGLAQGQSVARIDDSVWAVGFTKAFVESAGDQNVLFTRTDDGGATWTEPVPFEENADSRHPAGWVEIAYVPKSDLLYAIYFWNETSSPLRDGTDIFYRVSHDRGDTWSDRQKISLDGLSIFEGSDTRNGWFMDRPFVTSNGALIVGVSLMKPSTIKDGPDRWHTEVFFLRFPDAVHTGAGDPIVVQVTPTTGVGLSVPHPDSGLPFANEPSIAEWNGRLICIVRSRTGVINYSESFDDGVTWSALQPLRYYAGGPPLLHPNGPTTIRRFKDDTVGILFNNNPGGTWYLDGVWSEGWEPRFPVYLVAGRVSGTDENAGLYFGTPEIVLSHVGKPGTPTLRRASYPELFIDDDETYLFYSIDKQGIFFKPLSEELIERAKPALRE